MPKPDPSHLRELLKQTIGPAPWYWQTFPPIRSRAGQLFVWTYQVNQGVLARVVSLGREHERDKPRLALSTYCCPFLVPPYYLGVWCPESRNLRFTCFDPDQLKDFDLPELAGRFKQSHESIYVVTQPIAELEIPVALVAGKHRIDVPVELATVEELIVPTSYEAMSNDDPAFALFVFYLHAGLVEVLPQKWFTGAKYDLGYQWITRAARDPASKRLVGDGIRIGTFLLKEDGCRLEHWIEEPR